MFEARAAIIIIKKNKQMGDPQRERRSPRPLPLDLPLANNQSDSRILS